MLGLSVCCRVVSRHTVAVGPRLVCLCWGPMALPRFCADFGRVDGVTGPGCFQLPVWRAPVLAAPQWEKAFKLEIDASYVAAGTVLLQADDLGVDKPVCFISRKFVSGEVFCFVFHSIYFLLFHWWFVCQSSLWDPDIGGDDAPRGLGVELCALWCLCASLRRAITEIGRTWPVSPYLDQCWCLRLLHRSAVLFFCFLLFKIFYVNLC